MKTPAIAAVILTMFEIGIASLPKETFGACGGTDARSMQSVLVYAKTLVAKPGRDSMRTKLGVPKVDSASVRIVQSDSLCKLAGDLMNRERALPAGTTRTVYMVSVGNVFFANDPAIRDGEWSPGWVMDSTFTKVIAKVGM